MTAACLTATRDVMSDLDPAAIHGAAIGLEHVGIAGADIDRLAERFAAAKAESRAVVPAVGLAIRFAALSG